MLFGTYKEDEAYLWNKFRSPEFDPATGGPRLFTGTDGVWKAVFSVNCKDVVVQSPKQQNSDPGIPSKSGAKTDKPDRDSYSDMDDIPW